MTIDETLGMYYRTCRDRLPLMEQAKYVCNKGSGSRR
jgi:hypothetical protein